MIEKATALAETRGWDFDVLSPLQLALAIPSPYWRFYYTVELFCSIDGGAWGFVALKEFEVMGERDPEVSLAVGRLRQFFTPDEIDILPAPQYLIRYIRDIEIDIDDKVESQLGRAIDEALAQIDMAWTVLMLVNWGGKSAADAIAHVNASELQELSKKHSNSEGKGGEVMGLTQDDFRISQDKLDELNNSIEQAVSDYFSRSPEADPLDSMSVTFNFAFGFGRDLDVRVAGKTISVDLD